VIVGVYIYIQPTLVEVKKRPERILFAWICLYRKQVVLKKSGRKLVTA